MENRYDNKDFEHFVKQNADQYRMFPSEKVWEGINNTLHTRKRWYGIGLSLLLLTIGVVTWVMLLNPAGKKQSLANNTITASDKKITDQKRTAEQPVILIAKPKSTGSKVSATATTAIIIHDNLFLASSNVPAAEDEEDENELLPVLSIQNESNPVSDVISNHPELIALADVAKPSKQITPNKPAFNFNRNLDVIVKTINADNNTVVYTDLDKALEQKAADEKSETVTVAEKEKSIYPLTIESVVNSYQRIARSKKLSWQIYFLPTVSYRKLTENNTTLGSSQAVGSPLNNVISHDVNNAVTHKPDIGLELGFNVAYPVARNVKVTTGLQLNVSKYDIKAYPFPAVDQARIVLNNSNGSTSISTIETNYRNYESYTRPDWLSNFYLSASLPVGLEMNLTDTRKNTYLGIAGTLQPTYILGDRAYLISTDFKNYAEVPSLTRGWNVSTSFEVFAGYTTGKINWKVGPQVRYQMLSSFDKVYPVKEHIIDFGLKVGVILR